MPRIYVKVQPKTAKEAHAMTPAQVDAVIVHDFRQHQKATVAFARSLLSLYDVLATGNTTLPSALALSLRAQFEEHALDVLHNAIARAGAELKFSPEQIIEPGNTGVPILAELAGEGSRHTE